MIQKKLTFLLMVCLMSVSLSANNGPDKPVNVEDGKAEINLQMQDLLELEAIIDQEGLTYDQLMNKYPQLTIEANINASAEEEGLLDKSSDSPLGIAGFWWGFCLGWVGMLVIFLTMDEGSDRKEQIMNALWGCIIGAAVFTLLYFVFWIAILGSAGFF